MRIHSSLGSAAEQQSTFQEFGMLDDAFKLHKANGNFQIACEVAISIGLLDDALSLAENHVTLPNPVLANVFNYVQAKDILSNKSEPRKNQKNRRHYPHALLNSLQQQWKSLVTALDTYRQKCNQPDRRSIYERILLGYLDLLVCEILGLVYVTISQLTEHIDHRGDSRVRTFHQFDPCPARLH